MNYSYITVTKHSWKIISYFLILFLITILVSKAVANNLFQIVSFQRMSDLNSTSTDSDMKSDKYATYEWKLTSVKEGVTTFLTHIKGTKLLGVRGVTIIDMHISEVMAPFVNRTMAFEWIDMLKSIQAYPVLNSSEIGSPTTLSNESLNCDKNSFESDHNHHNKNNSFLSKIKRKITSFANTIRMLISKKKNRQLESKENKSFTLPISDPPLVEKFSQDGHIHTDIIHQELKLPWPIVPRDIVLLRQFNFSYEPNSSFGDEMGSVTVNYHSIEDSRLPEQDGYIRAIAPHIRWRFRSIPPDANACYALYVTGVNPLSHIQSRSIVHLNSPHDYSIVRKLLNSVPKGKQPDTDQCISNKDFHLKKSFLYRTIIEIECVVDSKGKIPIWFINFMQQSWPHKTLAKYRKLAESKAALPFQKVRDWL